MLFLKGFIAFMILITICTANENIEGAENNDEYGGIFTNKIQKNEKSCEPPCNEKIFAVFKENSCEPFCEKPIAAVGNEKGCDMPSDEALVCEMLLCNPTGFLIRASRKKCLQVNKRFIRYIASLGFFKNPPSCKSRDINCNILGEAGAAPVINQHYCNAIQDKDTREECFKSLRKKDDDR